MAKVYVVTSGEYSEYHIVAVYDEAHKSDAEEAARQCGDEELTEWELNVKPPLPPGHQYWYVQMDRDGNVKYKPILCNAFERNVEELGRIRSFSHYPLKTSRLDLSCNCVATSAEHAVKITNEKRLRLLAEDRWREGETA